MPGDDPPSRSDRRPSTDPQRSEGPGGSDPDGNGSSAGSPRPEEADGREPEGFDPAGESVPWRYFLGEATDRFRAAGIASAEVDARRIVEEASGFEGAELILGLGEPATKRGVVRFDHMVDRRLAGEPLQYVVGRWGFRVLDLMVDRRVLIPRPETEVVAGVALGEVDRIAASATADSVTVVDLGTGSGAIGLSVAAERPDVEVVLTDVSPDALAVARANLAGIGRAATRVRIAEGDWFAALPAELVGRVDVVVSNPPYVAPDDDLPADVADWEPPMALIADAGGLAHLMVLVDQAPDWLRPGGALVLEMAPTQTGAIAERAVEAGFVEVAIIDDLAGRPRAVRARLRA